MPEYSVECRLPWQTFMLLELLLAVCLDQCHTWPTMGCYLAHDIQAKTTEVWYIKFYALQIFHLLTDLLTFGLVAHNLQL